MTINEAVDGCIHSKGKEFGQDRGSFVFCSLTLLSTKPNKNVDFGELQQKVVELGCPYLSKVVHKCEHQKKFGYYMECTYNKNNMR